MKTTKQILKMLLLLCFSTVFSQNTVYQTSGGIPNGQGVVGNALFGVSTGASLIAGPNSSGCFNTFIGQGAGSATNSGTANTYLGNGAGSSSTTGSNNTFLGRGAGARCTGDRNTLLGNGAGNGGVDYAGSDNVFIGYASAYASSIASTKNVFIGGNSGYYNQGIENVFIGYRSALGSAPTTGSNNIFIGTNAGGTSGSLNNTLMIHNSTGLTVTTTPLILGNFASRDLTFNVTTSAASRVYINSGVSNSAHNGTSGLNLVNLRSDSNTAFTSNGKVLTVNAAGDVVLTTDQVGPGGNINVAAGANVSVSGNGSVPTPYIVSSQNIYTNDGTIDTSAPGSPTPGLRTVTMNGNNIHFKTDTSTESQNQGKIYIGDIPNLPGSYRLYVENGILTEKVKVALRNPNTNWADYVFGHSYKLMPLKEVEAFVKENKHLPGIESAEELTKNGLDLGEMQAKQMAKIEELTLHLIEQQKLIEQQNQDIKNLQTQMQSLLQKK